ncbi:MAG: nuclear transport factor 2 family protein [Solirubrobacterales bacterium]
MHEGHAGLAEVIAMLGTFERTLHEVSSVLVEVDAGGTEATGTAVCVAHHVRRVEGGGRADGDQAGGRREARSREAEDLVLHGRYEDRFARDEEGTWRFASRELHVLWTEKGSVRLA